MMVWLVVGAIGMLTLAAIAEWPRRRTLLVVPVIVVAAVAAWPSPLVYRDPYDDPTPSALRGLLAARDGLPPWHDGRLAQDRRDWLDARAATRRLAAEVAARDWSELCLDARPPAPRRAGPCVVNVRSWFSIYHNGSLARLNRFDVSRDGRTLGVQAWEDDHKFSIFGDGPHNQSFLTFERRAGKLVLVHFDMAF
jgi:hypothetical protein